LDPNFKLVFEGRGLYNSDKNRSALEVRFDVDYNTDKSKIDMEKLKAAFVTD
jgi:hypothetical protein